MHACIMSCADTVRARPMRWSLSRLCTYSSYRSESASSSGCRIGSGPQTMHACTALHACPSVPRYLISPHAIRSPGFDVSLIRWVAAQAGWTEMVRHGLLGSWDQRGGMTRPQILLPNKCDLRPCVSSLLSGWDCGDELPSRRSHCSLLPP